MLLPFWGRFSAWPLERYRESAAINAKRANASDRSAPVRFARR
jgi:hypothetical protein